MRLAGVLLVLLTLSCEVFASEAVMVNTDWLAKRLANPGIRIIDMSDDPQFQRFHIPGAIPLPYSFINQQNKQRISLSVGSNNIARLLGKLGISEENHVIIYDDIGGLNAGRLYWELERLGHKRVSVLDGGLVKWILEGRKVINTFTPRPAVAYSKEKNQPRDNLASLRDVGGNGKSPSATLLDVRTQEEYIGNSKQARSGHIPGAKWWLWQNSVNFENKFELKKTPELIQQLNDLGIKNKSDALIVYCRSGHRASQTYLTLRNLGFENVRLYDGSMKEYYQQKTLPLEKGKSRN